MLLGKARSLLLLLTKETNYKIFKEMHLIMQLFGEINL